MKRIVTIQDISCVGKCSLTVALPIISAMGVETAIIPTAVLSTHTMFKGFTFRDLTSDIKPIMEHWQKEGIGFDAIYTGYLGSFEQIDLMKDLFSRFRGKGTTVIVDPCMADNGKLYPGFTEAFAKAMAGLCSQADIIVPNLTEASFMLGIPYKAAGSYDLTYIEDLLKKLAALGAKEVVLKGIELPGKKGKIGIASYNAKTKQISWYFHTKMSTSFHGTGDIFASVLTGALVRGLSLEKAYALAGDFVVQSIKKTLSHKDHNTYGVDFEAAFPTLVRRLERELKA
ncbi:MAG: pyridoxamine kinase [Spirochaetales bacterium]|nr:pyridoxamine kinase [Spirochaetales bacterium]MBO6049157.1 pyridoxamine kinase [Spirochaetales bacterium]MBO7348388.1 pyridoxamine kinase [Spirochaetales bacterium]